MPAFLLLLLSAKLDYDPTQVFGAKGLYCSQSTSSPIVIVASFLPLFLTNF
jgi:hypothetical protein